MKVLLIDNKTTLLNKLKDLIPGNEIVMGFDVADTKDYEYFDLVILSGGSTYSVLWDENILSKELNFIKNTTKPVIGICFGFELIVKAFGGELKKLESREKGIKEIEILNNDFYNKSKVKVYENHGWAVEKLPDSFDILAKSTIGPEIIKHNSLPIYGFQFHPENFVDELDGDEIFLKIFTQLKTDIDSKI